jgi:hypothetical protein
MSRKDNPRNLSDAAIRILIEQDKCPMCLGNLDTGWECNSCEYDAKPLADQLLCKGKR